MPCVVPSVRVLLCVRACVCPPAAEASCNGVSAVLSCPLRTAAPSTLAPASNRSWRYTPHPLYCAVFDILELIRGLASDLTFVTELLERIASHAQLAWDCEGQPASPVPLSRVHSPRVKKYTIHAACQIQASLAATTC